MDYFFVKTKSDNRVYHLGETWYQRYRFVKIIIDNLPKEDLLFLREYELADNEMEETLWTPLIFGYLHHRKEEYEKIQPITHEEFMGYFTNNTAKCIS